MAVRIQDGSGNGLTSTSGALDVNVKSSDGATKLVDAAGTNQASISAAGAVKVDGSAVTQPVSGALAINNFPASTEISNDVGNPIPVAGAVAVSNFPATQPVSAASLPLPSGAATSANQATEITSLASIDTKTPALVSGRQPVDGSGVTQPVSGTVGLAAGAAVIGHVIVDTAPSTPVTGTFFQATQPVSAATLPLPTGAATSANQATPVVKGTQGSTAEPTQDLKDAGRTYLTFYVDRIAGITTEALVTMTINKGGTTSTGTSYTVTAGKTLRIQSVNAEILNTTTTINRVLIRVRSAATVLVNSPIIGMAMASSQAALAAAGDTDPHAFPDGLEIASGQQIGISQLCSVTTAGVVSAIVVGYEY